MHSRTGQLKGLSNKDVTVKSPAEQQLSVSGWVNQETANFKLKTRPWHAPIGAARRTLQRALRSASGWVRRVRALPSASNRDDQNGSQRHRHGLPPMPRALQVSRGRNRNGCAVPAL